MSTLRDTGGSTALHYAAKRGKIEMTHILISNGANLNLQDQLGLTALECAANAGKTEVIEFLTQRSRAVPGSKQGKHMLAALFLNKNLIGHILTKSPIA
ncbi:unnamed protein product [Microthlaspi erraticum]|uniref:Uncharacterized protein n=1 Tax=Microthlaspi erraticum TaxID=1685480 RepID=A0A6D2KKY5_9BRAS|nr:unnamed protein product [Microthlaspi erraticum]